MRFFHLDRFVSTKIDKFIRHLVDTNKASRSHENQNADILQMLINMQNQHGNLKCEIFKKKKNHMNSIPFFVGLYDKNFLPGHAMVLFLDGTETSSIALSFALYELARNPECQDKLYDEIIEKLEKTDENWSVDDLNEMTYIDGVILESLRIHPTATTSVRRCTKEYRLPKNKRQTEGVLIKPGTVVHIPVLGIHM